MYSCPAGSHHFRRAAFLAMLSAFCVDSAALAQRRPRPVRDLPPARPANNSSTVTISYPDAVKLTAFIDYVSQSTGRKIIYGEDIKAHSIIFRPGEVEVPRDQLLDLLKSMLRMRDLALVDADVTGWLRVLPTDDLQRHVRELREGDVGDVEEASNRVVSQVIRLSSADMPVVVKHLRSFLSSPKASVIEIPEKDLLIITDFESALVRATQILNIIDEASPGAQLVSIPVTHLDPAMVAERVTQVLQDKARIDGEKYAAPSLFPDLAGGGVFVVANESDVERIRGLVERFDVPGDLGRSTEVYAPKHISADRLKGLVELLLNMDGARSVAKLHIDEESNRLYVTAGPKLQEQIAELLANEDLPTREATRPLRLYHPKFRRARDLIGTLSQVLPNVTTTYAAPDSGAIQSNQESNLFDPPGPNRPPVEAAPGSILPRPPAVRTEDVAGVGTSGSPGGDSGSSLEFHKQVKRIAGKDFTLSFDEHTNAIIAVGTREFHGRLAEMLAELDRRRPQVLIEMTLVAITFNDSLSVAVELANEEMHGDIQTLVFSSFGLSGINLSNGMRSFMPGGGFNGVIMGPNETPLLMRAIAARGNSKIITTPKVVVSDNTAATISSVEEAPFTSINASDTVATTSFAGFESAGTTLTVTPHEIQGDFVALDYSFNFSNFTGSGSVGVPPPRTTNSFSGQIEVPDGHTVIVGGLVTENEADSVTEVPLLGRIPVVGVLFRTSDRARTKSRVFAFIKPTILRDDTFADLKHITQRDLQRAEIENADYPESEYQWMR